ncbi:hypothetical protein KY289_001408 [Solanum tuberosum]|nr:hypothetical protein KY289_001408 [Solanum tuberosum]
MEPHKDSKPAWLGMLKTSKTFEPNPDILHEQWIHPDNQEEPISQEKSNLLQKLASSRFHNMKNYHSKPYFPDLQYEENAFLSTSSHEGRSITEWNIDGIAEHQVYNKLHEIGVANTAYKMRGSADRDAANMVVVGFTGMLKHWWDNYCTDEIKQLIINATATESVIKLEGNTQSTSQVIREDAYKVRTKIQDRNNGNIPYGNLTYGDLVSTINVVALELCTDIKLKHQLKKEQSSSRKELGNDSTRPKKKKHSSKRPRDTKLDVCWTYGKTGHKASECRSGAKKKKINFLGMDEETKGKLLAILDEPFSESSSTSDEYSDDEDIDLDYDSDKSQSGKDCTCTEGFCTCDSAPHIRVLSDHSKEALFDVIQHINDNEARNCFLLELKNLLLNTDKSKPRPVIEPFSIKQIMNRSDNHSEPSISDLRHEVSSLKEEIRNIKSRLCIVETDILTNQVPKRTTLQDFESDQDSSQENDNTDVVLPNINNDHLIEPLVTNTGNDTSTSAAPGVTVISSIRPQSHHIPVKIVVSKHFVINKIALLDSGADRNCIVKVPWSTEQTQAVILVKTLVQTIPCLGIPNPDAFMIIETNASDAVYGGILKQKESMRSFRPNTPSKGDNLPKAKMARPFILSPLTPTKVETSQRPELTFQNKFTALANYPRLPCPSQQKLPCPPQPKMINLRPIKPFEQVKCWIPKQPDAKVQEKTRSSAKNLSKAALKQKLKEALDNMEKYDEHEIIKMIEDAASIESSSEDNGDMCDPKGLALAYMDRDYE